MIETKRVVEFIYFEAGGGHKATAEALKEAIAKTHPHWEVRLINLQEVLKSADPVHRLTRKLDSQTVYNNALKNGHTLGFGMLLSGLQIGIYLSAPRFRKILREHWRRSDADQVVSLIPNFNAVMFQALRAVRPHTPFSTVMTDLADLPAPVWHPGNFWQEPQEQFLICGTDIAVRQALDAGYRPEFIRQTSGMVLKPNFYNRPVIDRRAERIKLGIDPDMKTALIMFGGNGSTDSLKILTHLSRTSTPVQSIVMCGRNDELRNALKNHPRCHAVGFTSDVPHYMELADFFIGKPGPASITEALHLGLPVIVQRGMSTMPQERPNTDWVRRENLGIVISSFRQITMAVNNLLSGDMLERLQSNAAKLNNQAVHEIPTILQEIMESAPKAVNPMGRRYSDTRLKL